MKRIITIFFTLALLSISLTTLTNVSGPGGAYTNAPNESNCTSCHSGTLNAGGSLSNLKLDGNFTGGGYIPDSSYTMEISMSQSGISKWGFNTTVLKASDDKQAGDLNVLVSSRTQKRTKTVAGNSRQYIEHTSGGTSSSNSTSWTFEWTAPSSNVGDVVFYVALNAANGNGSNSGDDIYAKSFTISSSTDLPVATASTNDTLICSGNTADFKGSGTKSPNTYSWIFPNGSPSISSSQNPTVNFNFAGKQKAYLRVKNSKGWSDFDTIEIQVLQSPTSFISGGSTQKICKGGSVELTAQFNPTYSYKWSNGQTGNKLTVTDTGSYYVTVKSGTCEKVSNSIQVLFHDDVSEDLISSVKADSICQGETIKLSTTTGYDSFYWYRDGKLFSKTDTNFVNTAVDSNYSYTVRVKDNNGCIGPDSDTLSYKAVYKEPAPVVTCQNQTPFSVEFSWDGLQSHNGAQVSLNGGNTWVTPSSGSTGDYHELTGLQPEKSYEIRVRGILPAPCFYSDVTIKACSTGACSPLEASIVADSMICEGEELRVEVNGLSNERYSLSFEGGQSFTDTIFNFSPIVDKNYLLEILDSANLGCPAKELLIPVHIDKIEQLEFKTQRPNQTFCTGDTIEFSATAGNDSYSFFVNSTIRHTSTDSFYFEDQFNDGDSAFVTTFKGACSDTSETIYLSVVPVPTATFSYTSVGSMYSFVPDNGNYATYFWDFGDGLTSVLEEPDHSYKASSNQTVIVQLDVEDNNQCVASATDEIKLPDFSGLETLSDGEVNIYPSPAENIINIDFIRNANPVSKVRLLDLNGAVHFDRDFSQSSIQISLENLNSGIYIVQLKTSEGVLNKMIVKK